LENVVRKNIAYALAAIAGLALVGTACRPGVDTGAVGLGRMATSSFESQVEESPDADLGSFASANIDTGAQTLSIRWDSLDAVEQALICNLSDARGPHAAGARTSDADVAAFLIEKCN
jgi:hypothetical protein